MGGKDKILEQRGVNQDMCIETTKDDWSSQRQESIEYYPSQRQEQ